MSNKLINDVIEEWVDYYNLSLTKEQIESLSQSIEMMNEYESNQYGEYSSEVTTKKSSPNILIYSCSRCSWIGTSNYSFDGINHCFCPECGQRATLGKIIYPERDIASQF